jgi:transcriptional antiterminator NusG
MWCVVHVKDGGEEHTEDLVAGLLPDNLNARCFHLIRSRRKKYEGQWQTVQEDLFPGYVFIDTDQPDQVYKELKKTPRPRLLFSDEEYVSTLEKHESDLMERLADKSGRIGISRVKIEEDGKICYLSGPLSHMGDMVRRVNLHKRIAEIETEIMGRKRVLFLGIDIEEDERRKSAAS